MRDFLPESGNYIGDNIGKIFQTATTNAMIVFDYVLYVINVMFSVQVLNKRKSRVWVVINRIEACWFHALE